MHPEYKILPWDTDFFGFTVAKILPYRLKKRDLEKVLAQLSKKGVSLVYWASDPAHRETKEAASFFNGFLADKKVTYTINLRNLPKFSESEGKSLTEEFSGKFPGPEIEKLAIQAGVYSIFNVDPKIGKERFEELYLLWIKKSVDKTIADAVLVLKDCGKILGMVTVTAKDAYGSIGLLAVEESARGKKIGQKLLRAARDWFVAKNCMAASVMTQARNISGCRLYEKCGYYFDRTDYFYHFWL